jgi:hypothetical protein
MSWKNEKLSISRKRDHWLRGSCRFSVLSSQFSVLSCRLSVGSFQCVLALPRNGMAHGPVFNRPRRRSRSRFRRRRASLIDCGLPRSPSPNRPRPRPRRRSRLDRHWSKATRTEETPERRYPNRLRLYPRNEDQNDGTTQRARYCPGTPYAPTLIILAARGGSPLPSTPVTLRNLEP